ncbi:MAG: VPLPA-CTERM sorting domain-containing protein [Gammaproteobacteria bacterium]
MTNLERTKLKYVSAGIMAFSALTASTLPNCASAALVSGNAVITVDNDAFKASNLFGLYVEKHWGPEDNDLAIDKFTAGGTTLSVSGSVDMLFPVNSNVSTIECPTCGTYGRTIQATTMDAGDTAVGQIGLSGAWRLNSPLGVLTPYDFNLSKIDGVWNVRTYDTSFGTQTFLVLSNVSEVLNAKGELLLNGDLQWALNAGDWGARFGGNGNMVGHLSLAPAAVPLPASVWMLGSGLLGLLGLTKRRSKLKA